MSPQDRLIDAVTPYAGNLVDAVARRDQAHVANVLDPLNSEALHALAIVLASWVEHGRVLYAVDTELPAGKVEAARRAVVLSARRFGISTDELMGPSKARDTLDARSVACYAAHRLLGASSTVTGRAVNRDHTTVLHACGRVGEDPRLRRVATDVATQLGWNRGDQAPDEEAVA
jgi:hypothetical protein